MFDRFTDHARKAMALARKAAIELRQDCIAVDLVALGLMGIPDSAAVRMLKDMEISADEVAAAIRSRVVKRPATRTAWGTSPHRSIVNRRDSRQSATRDLQRTQRSDIRELRRGAGTEVYS